MNYFEIKHSKKRLKIIFYIFLFIAIIFSTLFLTSCSYTSASVYDNFLFSYNSTLDSTLITSYLNISNDNYLSLKSIDLHFDFYYNGTFIREEYYLLEMLVKPGESIFTQFSHSFKGNINGAVFTANLSQGIYDTLWNTYESWFIGAIVIISILLIIYLLIVAIQELDFSDVWDFITENWWMWIVFFGPTLITLITSGVTSSQGQYGPLIICASGIGILVVSCVIFHSIIIGVFFFIDYFQDKNHTKYVKNIKPYSDEIKRLSKDDLVHYCMSNNLITNNKRFKFYNKNEIIKLIKKWHSGEDIEKEMNYGLRSLNKTQLITYLGLLDCYYDKRMSNLKLACIIADVDYDNGKGLLNFFDLEELQKVCEKNNISNYKNLEQDKLLNLLLDSDLKKFNISINNEIIQIDENILWNKYHADKNEKNNESKIYSNKQNNNKVKTLKDIAGLEEVKKAFNEKIILPIKHADLYRNFNKKAGGGILLFGLPGTGKTLFAEAVSNEINAKFFSIKCSDIKSKWLGESEKKIKDLFKNARKEKIAIIFFDEFESIGKKRSSDDLGSETTVPEILAQMQGIGTDNNNILVIAATNRPWDIDSALLRPGRFDEKIYVPLPDYLARKEIFKIKLKDVPYEDIDFDYLASITNNCNGADISYFCERLKMSAINRSIESKQQQKISKVDIDKVKENFKSSVNLDDLKEMEMFLKN